MNRAFTLVELLVIVAILAVMVSIGVGTIAAGQGAARVKGATRDVYAAIRHARSVALVTGQRVLVTYSNATVDDEPAAKIEVVSAKIMSTEDDDRVVQPYYVMDYKDLPQPKQSKRENGESFELVHIRKAGSGEEGKPSGKDDASGETLEEVLFSPMDPSLVKGMRLKAVKGDEAEGDETDVQRSHRISMSSNVDWLLKLYKGSSGGSAESKEKEDAAKDSLSSVGKGGDTDDMAEPVTVTWETNGAVEPHNVWVYAAGQKPEQGLMLKIDRFGAIKVLGGDGREEE